MFLGVAVDELLGGTLIEEGDAAELGERKAILDRDLGCKRRMVY